MPPLTGPICGERRLRLGGTRMLVKVKVSAPGAEKSRPSSDTRRSTEWLGPLGTSGEAQASSVGETYEASVGPSSPKEQRMV